jgi:hypothetical protein
MTVARIESAPSVTKLTAPHLSPDGMTDVPDAIQEAPLLRLFDRLAS